MFDRSHYVPILKWKRGEYVAVSLLSDSVKDCITPVFDVPPIEFAPPREGEADEAFDRRFEQLTPQIRKFWGTDRRALFDLGNLPIGSTYRGLHPVEAFFDACEAEGLQIVPVTGVAREAPYDEAVVKAVRRGRRGVCIRIAQDDLASPAFETNLGALLDRLGIDAGQADLIIDLGALAPSTTPLAVAALRAEIPRLPRLHEWRTLTVASGAYPAGMSDLPLGRQLLPRSDWALWQNLTALGLPRSPTFADYGVRHPIMPDVDSVVANISASCAYTIEESWILHRGRGHRTLGSGGFGQYVAHARSLVADRCYRGPGYSAGDSLIKEIADGRRNHGNPEVWIRIGTNHHITQAVDSLASYPWP